MTFSLYDNRYNYIMELLGVADTQHPGGRASRKDHGNLRNGAGGLKVLLVVLSHDNGTIAGQSCDMYLTILTELYIL